MSDMLTAPQRAVAEQILSEEGLYFIHGRDELVRLRRLPSRLVVETRRHGDTSSYRVPRAGRPELAQWAALVGG